MSVELERQVLHCSYWYWYFSSQITIAVQLPISQANFSSFIDVSPTSVPLYSSDTHTIKCPRSPSHQYISPPTPPLHAPPHTLKRHSVLVVCHMAVLRCIYSYFMDIPLEELPYLLFDKHVFYELSPGPFGCQMTKRRPNEEVEAIVQQL